ncbi:crotonase/enoyl-CoA hydratase family protein [Lewinella cohaerens]|uniref:crotonase/enoyl-CoA hydratase family protein n=1 Tax=Lewinella cohaerens TaxID=70995 RepID=UPI00036E73FD|nr:crotonase/enoyl-CoA hydratase family protein [Lewinella cohaerens]
MSLVVTEIRGHLLLIKLNRPEKMNAFNRQMLRELAEAYTQMEDDPEIWCGLVYAEGEHFTSGLDLGDVGPAVMKGGDLFGEHLVDPAQTGGRLRTKPLVFAVKGYCLTIGIETLLAADIAVAAENTRFGQIEIKRGFIPFGGATVRMVQRCGYGNAMRYLLTGDLFSAREALRIGMIQEMTTEDPFDRALSIAETIASQAPLAVQATIASVRESIVDGEKKAMANLLPVARKLMQTEDAAEGLNSFLERREAQFKGK